MGMKKLRIRCAASYGNEKAAHTIRSFLQVKGVIRNKYVLINVTNDLLKFLLT